MLVSEATPLEGGFVAPVHGVSNGACLSSIGCGETGYIPDCRNTTLCGIKQAIPKPLRIFMVFAHGMACMC